MPNQLSGSGQGNSGIASGLLLPLTKDRQSALVRGERSTPSGEPIDRPITELKDALPAHNPHPPKLIVRAIQILSEVPSELVNYTLERLRAEIANGQRQHPSADMRGK